MRIVYLADAASVHTRRFVSYFAEMGCEIHVISFRPAVLTQATVHHIPPTPAFKLLGYLLTVPRVRRMLRSLSPDVVHAHYVSSYGVVASLAGYHPLIITAWGSDILLTPKVSPLHWLTIVFALSRADLVVSLAQHMTQRLRELHVPGSRLITSPFGVDTRQCHPDLRRRRDEDVDVICTRALEPLYNVALLIRALPRLAAQYSDLRCVLVGGGSQELELRALAQSLQVDRYIEWTGQVVPEEIGAWLARSRVFVSVALSDGNNVSLNEAMACGTFPVVSDIPANREWIVDGANGFLVAPDDPLGLAQRMESALTDSAFRRRAAEFNWEVIQRRGSWSRHTARMDDAYKALAMNRKRRRGKAW